MEDFADETIARMAGTNEKFTSHDPILRRFLTRAPWLCVTLLAGLINVGVMSSFQKHEGGVLTFALFFVPLINGMSGRSGCNAARCSSGSWPWAGFPPAAAERRIVKELLSGLFTGLIFGVGCGLIVYLLDSLGGASGLDYSDRRLSDRRNRPHRRLYCRDVSRRFFAALFLPDRR